MKTRLASAGRAAARESAPSAARRERATLFLNRGPLRRLVVARDHQDVALRVQVFARGSLRGRGRDAPDDRGVALDVVEAEAVDLRAQELVRHAGVRLEADREDPGKVPLRRLHLFVGRPLVVESRYLLEERLDRVVDVPGIGSGADLD